MTKTTIFTIITIAAILIVSITLFYEEIEETVVKVTQEVIGPKTAPESKKIFCFEYLDVDGKVQEYKVEFNKCSDNKASYCKDGVIISNCKLCGCGIGEECQSNGECLGLEEVPMGGEEEALEEEIIEEEIAVTGSCGDTDSGFSPNPIYQSGSCIDDTTTYYDICEDPNSGGFSTTWVKEYRCKTVSGVRKCVGEYKSCPSNTQIYYGTPASACGGNACSIPQTCSDGILNQDETGVDCGGVCPVCPVANCTDGIQNQDETGIDCGGVCPLCVGNETCSDGILNQDETGVDCGGICPACETCSDGILNQDETGVDCGGVCPACSGPQGCVVSPTDQFGLPVFVNSGCTDEIGSYSNSCSDPVGGGSSTTFIKAYVCVSDTCVEKYYSCPVMGENYFGQSNYVCNSGVCTT
ncbi:hypothetical protein GOV08_02155 [Candidatus Woesearchaeota archaeon]|nr:hypothetical protein [Candidatus Woesearchaeota archaeon]